jgi:hypothetical protein
MKKETVLYDLNDWVDLTTRRETPANTTTTNTLTRHALCFFPAQDEINDLNVHTLGRSGWR